PKAGLASVDCSAATPPPFTTSYAYDVDHRRTATTDPLGKSLSLGYDSDGNVTTVTDEAGNTGTIAYDSRDMESKEIVPFDATTTPVRMLTTKYDYDSNGNVSRVVSPRGWDASADKTTFNNYVTTYHYDPLDRNTRIDLPTNSTSPRHHSLHTPTRPS